MSRTLHPCKTISGRRSRGAATVREKQATTGRRKSVPRPTASRKAGTSRPDRFGTAGEKR